MLRIQKFFVERLVKAVLLSRKIQKYFGERIAMVSLWLFTQSEHSAENAMCITPLVDFLYGLVI